MAASIFDFTSKLNPHILAERMYRQQWRQNKFGQWVAPQFIKMGGKEEVGTLGMDKPNFTGAPVEVFENFVKEGKTDMDIPVRNRLIGDPVYGDMPMKGTGEGAAVAFRTISINATGKVYSPPTGMSEQITRPYAENLISQADDYLRQWWNDFHPGNFLLAILAGGSGELLAPTRVGGRALTYASHPNFIVAGSGPVGYGGGRPGTAGYEAAVGAAIDGMGNTAVYGLNVNLILNLVIEAARARINKVLLKNGFDFYPLAVPDAAWRQLQADPDFKDFYKRLPEGLKGHPLATGAEAYIGGCAIYPDLSMWAARTNAIDNTVTAGLVEYGPSPLTAQRALGRRWGTWINALDPGAIKMSVLIGQSMMSVGVGKKMWFSDQIDDHARVKEIGINTIQSVVRNDVYDLDGKVPGLNAGDFYENTSSLAVATYSPQALKYN